MLRISLDYFHQFFNPFIDFPQHLKESNSSVEYFVIGSAAYIVDSKYHKNSVPKGSLSFFWADTSKEGGFASVRVAATNMTLEFVDAFGASLYKRQLYPRNIHLNFKWIMQ